MPPLKHLLTAGFGYVVFGVFFVLLKVTGENKVVDVLYDLYIDLMYGLDRWMALNN